MFLLQDWQIPFVVQRGTYFDTDREELTARGMGLPQELVTFDSLHLGDLVLPLSHSSAFKLCLRESFSFAQLCFLDKTVAHVR